MVVLLTVALTAVVVGAIVGLVVARSTRDAITRDLGGRPGVDPVDQHRRMLAEAKNDTTRATAHADLLALALDALTSGVVVIDDTNQELVRNRFASKMSIHAHEQTLVDAATTELLGLALSGHPAEREVEIFGPPTRYLFVNSLPIVADGQRIGALAVIDDVSDQHRIDKTRRDFIANLSHELRTPVGAVSLLSEMLVDEDDATTRSQLTDRLMIETDRMTETIDALLELSRIEGKADRYDEPIIAQELMKEAVERTRVAAESTGVQVGVVAPTDAIALLGNQQQLLSALVNLVENAIKYSSPGDSVSVRARAENDSLAFIVQDTGRGIPQRDVGRVFERFYRVDRSRDATTGGTGIGLSIVKHVAINHGGTVEVESFEGDGSTFSLNLPLPVSEVTRDARLVNGGE